MDLQQLGLSVLVGAVVLFLWTGFAQNVLPWGVKSVRAPETPDGTGAQIARSLTSGMLYVKDQVAAFIAVRPESYYAMGRFFALEFVTQLGASAVLTAMLLITSPLPDAQRLLLIGLVGAASAFSVDLQYWNWWGFSTRYSLGVAVNRLVGYLLAAGVLLAWVV